MDSHSKSNQKKIADIQTNKHFLGTKSIREGAIFHLKNALTFSVLIVLSQAPTFILLFILQGEKTFHWSQIITILLSILAFSIILGLAYLFSKKINVIKDKPLFIKKNILFIVIGYIVMQLSSNFFLFLEADQGVTKNLNILQSAPGFIMFLIVGIVTPILEEVVFRGFLMGYWFREYPKLGLFLNIIIFTMIHGPKTIYSLLMYVGTAVILGVVYNRTKRLGVTSTIHIFNNLPGAFELWRLF